MKSKFSKILSVGLVVAVLASLLVISTPASAGNETFTLSSSLSKITGKLAPGTDILDVAANGSTAYVSVSDNTIWKTTDGGSTFTKTGYAAGAPANKLSVAPDSADWVAAAVGSNVYVSINGGATFGTNNPGGGFGATVASVSIGPLQGSFHVMAAASGSNTWVFAPDPTNVFGAFNWTNVTTGLPTTANITSGPVLAVQVSPGYLASSDYTIVTVSQGATGTLLNFYNTAFQKWNADVFLYGAGNGGTVITSANATMADIALPASYNAFDTSGVTRVAYLALGSVGLYRNTTQLSANNVYSAAVSPTGDKLVAGATTTNTVYSIASPTGLTWVVGSSLKSPGGANNVVVAYLGTSVGAATSGAESGFSLSTNGSSFNDVALIDTVPNVRDLAVNSDASKMYLVTYNAGTTSLWRKATDWVRVDRVTGDSWMVRPSKDNFDVIFIAQKSTANMFYSNDAGEAWQPKYVLTTTIADVAPETPSTIYVLNTTGAVYKATDGGIFYTPQTVNVGAGGSLNLLSAGNLIACGASGVAYTTDGGTTWTSPILTLANTIAATADKLTAGGKITAITASTVNTYTIGTSTAFSAKQTAALTLNSVAVSAGVSYAMSSNSTNSIMYRSPITNMTYGTINATPGLMTLKVAGGALYALGNDNAIYTFSEVLATAGPAQTGPADNFLVPINMETGNANNVVFQWTAIPGSELLGASYNLQIALDSGFAQVVYGGTGFTPISDVLAIVGPTGGTGFIFNFQADTTYYWRVRVTGPVDSPWSATRKFKIETLAPVKLVSPTNGAMDVSVTPTFAWSPAAGATGYELVVSDDPTFAIITFSRTSTQAVFASDEQLAYSTVYYWRVRPTGPAYPSTATPYVTGIFTTEERAPEPTTPPPTTTTTTTITISVPPATEAIPAYLLWIIIGIGAILVIALIVLIVRTRRVS